MRGEAKEGEEGGGRGEGRGGVKRKRRGRGEEREGGDKRVVMGGD